MSGGRASWEGQFTLSCSQCGGESFTEVFAVPAHRLRAYLLDGRGGTRARDLVASLYACEQCGHLEWFVDPEELPSCGEAGTADPSGADQS